MSSLAFAEYWGEQRPLRPSQALKQLAEAVLEHSTKRSPIWKFRLAPDLILSMQPKAGVEFAPGMPRTKDNLVAIRWFECRAAEGEAVAASTLVKRQPEHRYLIFRITSEWLLQRRGIRYKRGERGVGPSIVMQERIEAAFAAGFFDYLHTDRMLGHFCLCCGKGLTDPVSMARLIGPECFGSASANLPWVIRIEAEPREAAE